MADSLEIIEARKKAGRPRYIGLSPAELPVFELLIRGKSNGEIASALGKSTKTIKFHVRNIIRKKSAASRIQLIIREIEIRQPGRDLPFGSQGAL